MDKKVWFITGASKGLGLALIKKLLAAGHRVAAASKHLPALVEAISKTPDAGFLPLEFDAADEVAVARSIHATRETSGKTTTRHIAERLTQEAKNLLRHTNWNIGEVAWCLGFEERSHFINFFKKNAQVSPGAFRDHLV